MSAIYNVIGMNHFAVQNVEINKDSLTKLQQKIDKRIVYYIKIESNMMGGPDILAKKLELLQALITSESLQITIDKLLELIFWTEKLIIKEVTSLDNYDKIQKRIIEQIPIRSGLLADTLLNSILLEDIGNNNIRCNIVIPAENEYLSGVNVKHSNEIGSGKDYTPVNELVKSRVTKFVDGNGKTKYLLNDPNANSNFANDIPIDILAFLMNNLSDHIKNIKCNIKTYIEDLHGIEGKSIGYLQYIQSNYGE